MYLWRNHRGSDIRTSVENCAWLTLKDMSTSSTYLIAIYLPQFHPIPENNAWWGKGFTEWTNVAKARPKFAGHYQPHIPADLGFYDLRLPEARKAQADLAREYGIHGFCYYHYWFNGKRLLGYPLDEVLRSDEPDFPFCLCWANENWTRIWDGENDAVLAEQHYSEDDDRAHIEWLLGVFRDKRYIRVAGKPLIIIYRASKLPFPRRTAEIWREAARKSGMGEIFLCWFEHSHVGQSDPREMGFDAAVEFQPDWGNLGEPAAEIPETGHRIYDYRDFSKRQINKPQASYLRFPCVTPSWDNSPRRSTGALTLANAEPCTYGSWLSSALSKVKDWPSEERIVFINAWNEWAEGNHLEPDLRFGRAYLEMTRDALSGKPIPTPATLEEEADEPLPDPLSIYSSSIQDISTKLEKLVERGVTDSTQLKDIVQALSKAIVETEDRLRNLYAQAGCTEEIREKEQRIVVLEREIRLLKSSRSWTLTRPLRFIYEKMRKR